MAPTRRKQPNRTAKKRSESANEAATSPISIEEMCVKMSLDEFQYNTNIIQLVKEHWAKQNYPEKLLQDITQHINFYIKRIYDKYINKPKYRRDKLFNKLKILPMPITLEDSDNSSITNFETLRNGRKKAKIHRGEMYSKSDVASNFSDDFSSDEYTIKRKSPYKIKAQSHKRKASKQSNIHAKSAGNHLKRCPSPQEGCSKWLYKNDDSSPIRKRQKSKTAEIESLDDLQIDKPEPFGVDIIDHCNSNQPKLHSTEKLSELDRQGVTKKLCPKKTVPKVSTICAKASIKKDDLYRLSKEETSNCAKTESVDNFPPGEQEIVINDQSHPLSQQKLIELNKKGILMTKKPCPISKKIKFISEFSPINVEEMCVKMSLDEFQYNTNIMQLVKEYWAKQNYPEKLLQKTTQNINFYIKRIYDKYIKKPKYRRDDLFTKLKILPLPITIEDSDNSSITNFETQRNDRKKAKIHRGELNSKSDAAPNFRDDSSSDENAIKRKSPYKIKAQSNERKASKQSNINAKSAGNHLRRCSSPQEGCSKWLYKNDDSSPIRKRQKSNTAEIESLDDLQTDKPEPFGEDIIDHCNSNQSKLYSTEKLSKLNRQGVTKKPCPKKTVPKVSTTYAKASMKKDDLCRLSKEETSNCEKTESVDNFPPGEQEIVIKDQSSPYSQQKLIELNRKGILMTKMPCPISKKIKFISELDPMITNHDKYNTKETNLQVNKKDTFNSTEIKSANNNLQSEKQKFVIEDQSISCSKQKLIELNREGILMTKKPCPLSKKIKLISELEAIEGGEEELNAKETKKSCINEGIGVENSLYHMKSKDIMDCSPRKITSPSTKISSNSSKILNHLHQNSLNVSAVASDRQTKKNTLNMVVIHSIDQNDANQSRSAIERLLQPNKTGVPPMAKPCSISKKIEYISEIAENKTSNQKLNAHEGQTASVENDNISESASFPIDNRGILNKSYNVAKSGICPKSLKSLGGATTGANDNFTGQHKNQSNLSAGRSDLNPTPNDSVDFQNRNMTPRTPKRKFVEAKLTSPKEQKPNEAVADSSFSTINENDISTIESDSNKTGTSSTMSSSKNITVINLGAQPVGTIVKCEPIDKSDYSTEVEFLPSKDATIISIADHSLNTEAMLNEMFIPSNQTQANSIDEDCFTFGHQNLDEPNNEAEPYNEAEVLNELPLTAESVIISSGSSSEVPPTPEQACVNLPSASRNKVIAPTIIDCSKQLNVERLNQNNIDKPIRTYSSAPKYPPLIFRPPSLAEPKAAKLIKEASSVNENLEDLIQEYNSQDLPHNSKFLQANVSLQTNSQLLNADITILRMATIPSPIKKIKKNSNEILELNATPPSNNVEFINPLIVPVEHTNNAESITPLIKSIQNKNFACLTYLDIRSVVFGKHINRLNYESNSPFLEKSKDRHIRATIRVNLGRCRSLHIVGDTLKILLGLNDKEWHCVMKLFEVIEHFEFQSMDPEPTNKSLPYRILYYLFKTFPKFSSVTVESVITESDDQVACFRTNLDYFKPVQSLTKAFSPMILENLKVHKKNLRSFN